MSVFGGDVKWPYVFNTVFDKYGPKIVDDFGEKKNCEICGTLTVKRCQRCHTVRYCSILCQRVGWSNYHGVECTNNNATKIKLIRCFNESKMIPNIRIRHSGCRFKGYEVVATCEIKNGTIFHEERPAMMLTKDGTDDMFKVSYKRELDFELMRTYLNGNLDNKEFGDSCLQVYGDKMFLFLWQYFYNHSCTFPSAFVEMHTISNPNINFNSNVHVPILYMRAVVDIHEGDVITYPYFPLFWAPLSIRTTLLRDECRIPMCLCIGCKLGNTEPGRQKLYKIHSLISNGEIEAAKAEISPCYRCVPQTEVFKLLFTELKQLTLYIYHGDFFDYIIYNLLHSLNIYASEPDITSILQQQEEETSNNNIIQRPSSI